jgi:pyruvate dehydrogenase E2 component (dihydrolipoamide acetyltransferase)
MLKLRLPALGQTMERALIHAWLLEEGATFTAGDPLYEVETEKATIVVDSSRTGTLRRIVAQPGTELVVGSLVAIAAEREEAISDADIDQALQEEEEAAARANQPTAPVRTRDGVTAPNTAAPRRSATVDVRGRATPRARTIAQKLLVDLAAVQGSGANGMITAEDVERAAEGTPTVRERRPLTGTRRTMSDVVTRSWNDVPQFVQQVWADASSLVAARARERGALSYTDLLLKAVVDAVGEAPEVNARFGGEEIVLFEDVNLSVAIATDKGLVVPVIPRAQTLSLGELGVSLRELSGLARTSRLEPRHLRGGTITVSNLGAHGVETGVPLVMAPQAAIVFIGSIVDRPVGVDGNLELRPTIGLAIAFDHRVVDGAEAARFTTAVKRRVETP